MPDLTVTEAAGELTFTARGRTLARYVHDVEQEPRGESPRPYMMLRTLAGREASGHRPADHVWHRGLSLALPNVGPHNFWGGPTYLPGRGYVQLDNNGTQRHLSFDRIDGGGVERVSWVGADGAEVLTEERTLVARLFDGHAWALSWRSVLTNVGDEPLAFGSPTSNGRPDAGYAGVFWRGPVSFTGGRILAEAGPGGDDARGGRHDWLAFVAPEAGVGVLMVDDSQWRRPTWFARSKDYAGLGPAPFFHEEAQLHPGGAMCLGAVIAVCDGDPLPHLEAAGRLRGGSR